MTGQGFLGAQGAVDKTTPDCAGRISYTGNDERKAEIPVFVCLNQNDSPIGVFFHSYETRGKLQWVPRQAFLNLGMRLTHEGIEVKDPEGNPKTLPFDPGSGAYGSMRVRNVYFFEVAKKNLRMKHRWLKKRPDYCASRVTYEPPENRPGLFPEVSVCLDREGVAQGVSFKSDQTQGQTKWLSAGDIWSFGYVLTEGGLVGLGKTIYKDGSFRFERFIDGSDYRAIAHSERATLFPYGGNSEAQSLFFNMQAKALMETDQLAKNFANKCAETVFYPQSAPGAKKSSDISVCLDEQGTPLQVVFLKEQKNGGFKVYGLTAQELREEGEVLTAAGLVPLDAFQDNKPSGLSMKSFGTLRGEDHLAHIFSQRKNKAR